LLVSDVYNVVEFTQGSEAQICVIPIEWLLDDNRCVWPPYRKQKQINQAVRCRQQPEEAWEVYDIRILGCAGILFLLLHIYVVFVLCCDNTITLPSYQSRHQMHPSRC